MAIPNIVALRGLTQLPALTPMESAVGRAWLEEHFHEFDSVEFNVRLGLGLTVPAGAPEYLARFAKASTTNRADMILRLGRDVTIVEVKDRIGGAALGQLTLYKKLYIAEHPEVAQVHLVVAGRSIQFDAAELYAEHNITVELFPVAGGKG